MKHRLELSKRCRHGNRHYHHGAGSAYARYRRLARFAPILPAIGIYSIGFSVIGLCWLTHHRYFAKMEIFNRKMVWSNFFFLFVVSLLPLLVRNLADHPGMQQTLRP